MPPVTVGCGGGHADNGVLCHADDMWAEASAGMAVTGAEQVLGQRSRVDPSSVLLFWCRLTFAGR